MPTLEQAASGRGLFTIRPERDGIVRRVPVVMQAQGTIMPSLTLEMLRVVSGSNTVLIRSDHAGVQSAAVPGFVIPTDRNGQLWIHFAPHDKALYVSAVDVLEGRVPADRVAQRLVLIGTSAVGLLNSKTTPVDPLMPGVEVHAQVLENILTNSVLSSPNYAIGVELCAALLLGIVIIWLAPTLNPLLLSPGRRNDRRDIHGRFVVLLRAEQAIVRFHLSAAVERPRLSHAGVQQLHQRGSAAPPHPLGLRPVSFPRAGRAARDSRPTSSCLAAKTAK